MIGIVFSRKCPLSFPYINRGKKKKKKPISSQIITFLKSLCHNLSVSLNFEPSVFYNLISFSIRAQPMTFSFSFSHVYTILPFLTLLKEKKKEKAKQKQKIGH